MEKRRVVITGMGVVTPIGNDVEQMWESIQKEFVGIGKITCFDASSYKVKLAAEIKGLEEETHFTAKERRSLDVVTKYALIAAKQAVEQAQIPTESEDAYRCGVMIGTAGGGEQTFEMEASNLLTKGNRFISAYSMPKFLGNMLSANVAIKYGMKGKCFNVASACATGTHAIGEAYRSIQYGDCDLVLTGGADACVSPLAIASFQSLTALTESEDPTRASIPFDKERSGFVMGEGAGVLVLEELSHAKKRNANILAEIVGFGATCDAGHITAPNDEGSAHAMAFALEEAGVGAEAVQLINAHGTSTQINDLMESRAIQKVFGAANKELLVQSSKSMLGHLLGAAGAVESVICVKEIQEQYVHANVGLENPEEEFDLQYVREAKQKELNYVLNNSLAFGGQNAALLLKKYCE